MKFLSILILLFFATISDAQIVKTKYSKGNPAVRPNQLPVANAGIDKVVTLPTNSTTFFGSGTDTDGFISSYSWLQISGPSTAILTGSNTATLLAGSLIQGTYIFQLTVTDNKGATASDNVSVVVNAAVNIPPVANAGTDSIIILPINTVHLFGSGTDVDGTIVSYFWEQSSGPAFGGISTPSNQNTAVVGLTNGTYKFKLTVTDNNGAIGIDFVTVTVNQSPSIGDWTGKFTFTIDTASYVSAGIYLRDSFLIKSLWNNESYAAGTYTKSWDGKDDYGRPIPFPDSNYTIKVLSNNVKYEWQGVLGNTSDSMTGNTVHRGYYEMATGLTFGSTYGYFCNGYSEGFPAIGKFNIATPNKKEFIYSDKYHNAITNYVATDGTTVYWAAGVAASNVSFIYATKVSDDTQFNFSTGINYVPQFGTTYNVVCFQNLTRSQITGLAVQKTGNFIFVARGLIDSLIVANKITGQIVQRLPYDSVRGMCVDASDNLWLITGTNTVTKYSVNIDGSLTSTGIGLGGLIAPLTSQVNTAGTQIAIADAGSSQQVKFFNNSTGSAIDTLGILGGYFTGATVSNSKFYFSDSSGFTKTPFIAYQPDGTFWVNDQGNYRVQHFTAGRTFINRIMSIGATYQDYVDKNNIYRVFAQTHNSNALEFYTDYSAISGSGGWDLKKNWGAKLKISRYGLMSHFMTLSNNRTYALIGRRDLSFLKVEVIELVADSIRFTGILLPPTSIICNDGSLQDYAQVGLVGTLKRYPLTGFTGNNPTWGTVQNLTTVTANTTTGNPVVFPRSQIFTSTNKLAFFNYKTYAANASGTIPAVWSTGYHLGITYQGGINTFLAQTEKSTHKNYAGAYPKAGWYDAGNTVNDFGGGNVQIIDSNIITTYHGEFWKQGQTNEYNHYWDNGLALGQFGTTRYDIGGPTVIAAAKMAGNANAPIMVKDSIGDLYLYHGDESDHPGIHRWKISQLNTVKQQVIKTKFPYGYVASALDYTDLMAGIPFDKTLPDSANGWTRTPARDTIINPYTDNWVVYTSVLKYDSLTSRDIQVRFSYPSVASDRNIQRDLGTNNVTTNWKITGNIAFPGGIVNGNKNNLYIDTYDDAGKLLTTFYLVSQVVSYPTYRTIAMGNTSTIFSLVNPTGSAIALAVNPFEISIVGGVVTFTYAGYSATTTISDATGNWRKPKTFKIRTAGTSLSNNQNYKFDISDLRLYIDYL